MATIQKRPRSNGNSYRVIIRKKGIKQISKIFSSKKFALQFAQRVESDKVLLLAYGNTNKANQVLDLEPLSFLTKNHIAYKIGLRSIFHLEKQFIMG
jgi:hypothetical protein